MRLHPVYPGVLEERAGLDGNGVRLWARKQLKPHTNSCKQTECVCIRVLVRDGGGGGGGVVGLLGPWIRWRVRTQGPLVLACFVSSYILMHHHFPFNSQTPHNNKVGEIPDFRPLKFELHSGGSVSYPPTNIAVKG